MRAAKRLFPFLLIVLTLLSIASCSQPGATKQIRASLFLLDASKSTISSVLAREEQLRERLSGVFDNQEAVYFHFIRVDFTKQLVTPLVSMQTIINVSDAINRDAKDSRVRGDTEELVARIWQRALSSSEDPSACSTISLNQLIEQSVLSESSARSIARNLCVSAAKAKQTFMEIRSIGSGESINEAYIGSDVQGAFLRGLTRLEAESKSLINADNELVGVRSSIIISSDMMQRDSNGNRVIDEIRGYTQEEISEYVMKSIQTQEFRSLRPSIIIDGWLSTKRNFSEPERILLESYWKSWFVSLDLDEPDFGFGIVDWSVAL